MHFLTNPWCESYVTSDQQQLAPCHVEIISESIVPSLCLYLKEIENPVSHI